MKEKKAIVLLSGGLDSATSTAIALEMGFTPHALTFTYGQKHDIEVEFAKGIVDFFDIKNHTVVNIPSEIFNSALVKGSDKEVPKGRDFDSSEIPDTYVPGRNILFLSYALSLAESISARSIFIGANDVDYSGYPDCRPDFFNAYEVMANLGTKAGVSGDKFIFEVPLLHMNKAEIIKKGVSLGVDYSLTHSCYDPVEKDYSCGVCDSCIIRKKGFLDAGIPDPTRYK